MNQIFAIAPPNEDRDWLVESLQSGISRFDWGEFVDKNLCAHDLSKGKTESNADIYSKAGWYRDRLNIGDYLVYKNLSHHGSCHLVKVIGDYYFDDKDDEKISWQHLKHARKCKYIGVFNRNADFIAPDLSQKLKLPGSHNIVNYDYAQFECLIPKITGDAPIEPLKDAKEFAFTQRNLESEEILSKILGIIQINHPSESLEGLVLRALKKDKSVLDVHSNGKGWRSDHGADLLVEYKSIDFLPSGQQALVQVKSYTGEINNQQAIKDIKRAFEVYKGANLGIIATTGHPSEDFLVKLGEVSEECGKPIELIAGKDFAKFILFYLSEELFPIEISDE